MKELLKKLNACNEAQEWAANKTWVEVYKTCHRGDWLLWLFISTNPEMKRQIILAKGHCAATVLHLMKDQRSKDAVKAAIDYGNGLITDEQLKTAADAAVSASASASAAYAKTKNQKETANICRKYLPIEIWNV